MSDLSVVPVLYSNGTDLEPQWYDNLVDVRVELEFRLPGRAVLRFADPGFRLMETKVLALGTSVEVKARDDVRSVTLMKGFVTGLRVDADMSGNLLEVVVHDAAHVLARGTTVASYLQMTAADVVKKIAGRVGLSFAGDATTQKLDYLLQVDSDLAMLDALADRTGFDWWVEDRKLHFDQPRSRGKLEADLGDTLERLEVRASALRPDAVAYAGWDPVARQTFHSQGRLAAERASVLNGGEGGPWAKASTPSAVLPGTSTAVGSDAVVRTSDEATLRAKAAAVRYAAGAVTATAVLHDVLEVRLGWDLVVGSAGTLSGTYHVSRIEHRFLRSGYDTVLTAGDRRPASLVDTLGQGARPGATAPAPPLVAALVTLVGNPQVREEAGRVKVKFQGLALEGPAGQESHWARVMTAGGGSDRGVLVMPEINDEVLVGFERGDLRSPVVFGGLVAGAGGELYRLSGGKLGVRGLRSRLGHLIELADGVGPDDQHVLISLQGKKHRFRLGKDRCDLEVPTGTPLRVKVGTSKLDFDGNGKLDVEAMDITVKAQNKLELSGSQVTIKGTAKVAVETSGQGTFKASATLGLEATGITTVKGAMVNIN